MNSSLFGTRAQRWVLSLLLPAFALSGQPLRANPSGGVVVHGQAVINQVSASHLQINQQSQSAIINWTDFSIGAGELTQFVQPGSSASVLNRVTGGNVSQIHGMLQGNGNVFVINTAGIVIGASGVVDVGGMTVLSTLDIDDQDFLDGGPSRFYGDSTTGVTNFGTISSSEGDVVLLGGFVDNQGQIGALNGTVALGSGGDILLEQANGAQITVRGNSDYTGTGVNNEGAVSGAAVEMKAHGNVYALAINNTGMVRATGASRANGRVRLMASGSSSNINLGNTSQLYARNGADGGSVRVESVGGNVTNAGAINATGSVDGGDVAVVGNTVTTTASSVIEASGVDEGGMVQIDSVATTTVSGLVEAEATFGTGGRVEITGSEVELTGVTEVSVDGAQQGGSLRIGGEFQGRDDLGLREADFTTIGREAILTADSRQGNAGSVIVWANQDTMYLGEASASALGPFGNGGLIEISGLERLAMRGDVAATSVNGESGTVLFDPGTLTVGYFNGASTGFNEIEIADINKILQGGTSVLLMTSGVGSDIIFEDVELAGSDFGGNVTTGTLDPNTDFDDPNHARNSAIQWTNSDASFGAFAGGSIILNNHIRTSGEGSINLIAGWTGLETDAEVSAYIPGNPGPGVSGDGSGLTQNGSLIGQDRPQNLFRTYVSAGEFGENGGTIFVGETGMSRHVEVGSRYGDTNLAAFDIIVAGGDNNIGNLEEKYAQIGFRDSGSALTPRFNNTDNNLDLDLNNGDYLFDAIADITGFSLAGDGTNQFEVADIANSGLQVGQKVELAGIRNTLTTETYVIASIDTTGNFFTVNNLSGNPLQNENTTPNNNDFTNRPDEVRAFKDNHVLVALAGVNEVDRNGDGLVDGVHAVNESGALTDTFVPYANHFNSARVGNYWWQQIHEASLALDTDPGTAGNQSHSGYVASYNANDRGGNRPEMGAGTSDFDGADINVIAKGSVELSGGGRTGSGAMIGHGGYSAGWGQDRSIRDDRFFFGQTPYYYSVNGAHNDRSGVSIGRLAGVYGNVNVLAGVDEVSAIDTTGNIVATYGEQGNIVLRGLQRMGSANNPTNEEQANAGEAGVQIGHGGVGQFGVYSGDITVKAAGEIELTAGSQSRGSATIGHNVNGYQYWNPHDNVNQQFRFFGSAEDFDDPLLRRGELFTATTNIPSQTATGDTFSGTRPRALSDPGDDPQGIAVEALDGSIENGFFGDIEVTAINGSVTLTAYSTPDRSNGIIAAEIGREAEDMIADNSATLEDFGLQTNRDRRYAQIGHGGSTFSAWSEQSGYVPNRTDRNAELVQFRAPNNDSGSAGIIGEAGAGKNRALTFMTISGDIDVTSGGDLTLEAGNDQYSFAQVGHGGADLADFETSSFVNGDITVDVTGKIDILGGGAIAYTGNANNRRMRSYGMIGHGGFSTGFMAYYGNIDVESGGDITLTGGAYDYTFAMIGHQGGQNQGQTGGDYTRVENFDFDSSVTDITTEIVGSNATVTYTNINNGLQSAVRTYSDISTTDISVTSGGSLTMNHLGQGIGFNNHQDRLNRNRNATLNSVEQTSVQIGHGGIGTGELSRANSSNDFGDKIGDITVLVNGGDILMENGNGDERWTRIGHGIGRNERGDWQGDSTEIAGDIRVEASGSITLDAEAADSYGRLVNADSISLGFLNNNIGDPSRWNPVTIGHGGPFDNNGLIVLDEGSINGVDASSDITVRSGADITVAGGEGIEGTYAQIGHGYADFIGNSNQIRKNGQPNGFAGDISVSADNDITVKGGDLAFLLRPLLTDDDAVSIVGAYGVIGHAGYAIDAEAHGDINVYAGNNLSIAGQQRTQAAAVQASNAGYVYTPPTGSGQSSNVASLFNFAKIGHANAENGNASVDGVGNPNFGDAITNATQTGDITVVVGNNFSLAGGTTIDESAAPIAGAFAQVGHGGPGIAGSEFSGDITVLVGNNIATTGGTVAADTLTGLNNYAMIGNGDRVRFDPVPDNASVFYSESLGLRVGDINVAAGNSADFTNTLIGHLDPAQSSQASTGVTRVAVSRNNPFFGGSGTLTSTGSIFSSGSGGGERLEFYMPARSSNLIDDTTRLNEVSAAYTSGTPGNFVGLDGSGSETSGRDDEVYLTPDLWWDAAGIGAANGFTDGGAFPTDATSGQGGGIAEVGTPGGFPNLVSLTQGALGSSATTYRTSNGVNGVGQYTFFYDALESVAAPSLPGPPPPIPPVIIPFPFIDFVFEEQFDSFDRYQEFLENGLTGGQSGNNALGIFETDEVEAEDNAPGRLENRLDNLVGDRRDSFSDEEQAEEEEARRRRGAGGVGPIGLTFYVFDPGTNRYSSYRVFGTSMDQFYPTD